MRYYFIFFCIRKTIEIEQRVLKWVFGEKVRYWCTYVYESVVVHSFFSDFVVLIWCIYIYIRTNVSYVILILMLISFVHFHYYTLNTFEHSMDKSIARYSWFNGIGQWVQQQKKKHSSAWYTCFIAKNFYGLLDFCTLFLFLSMISLCFFHFLAIRKLFSVCIYAEIFKWNEKMWLHAIGREVK